MQIVLNEDVQMTIKVSYAKVENKEAAYQAVKAFITPEMIAKWKVTADVNSDDNKQIVSAKGKGFELNITFLDTEVQATIKLSLLLRALKGMISDNIEKQLKRVV